MKTSLKNWVFVGLMVVIGFECGILFERFTSDPVDVVTAERPLRGRDGRPAFGSDDAPDRFVLRLSQILDLTSEQTRDVEVVVRQSRDRIHTILSGVRPDIASEVDSLSVEIRSLLTPDQGTAFDALLEEDNTRFRSRMQAGLVGSGVLN